MSKFLTFIKVSEETPIQWLYYALLLVQCQLFTMIVLILMTQSKGGLQLIDLLQKYLHWLQWHINTQLDNLLTTLITHFHMLKIFYKCAFQFQLKNINLKRFYLTLLKKSLFCMLIMSKMHPHQLLD